MQPSHPNFAPTQILEVELSQPLPSIDGSNSAGGQHYARAQTLVRLHGHPIGLVKVDLTTPLTPDQYAQQIWQQVGSEIHRRSAESGMMSVPSELTGQGLHFAAPITLPDQTLPLVSIVIATRERPDRLRACLETALIQDYPNFEIVIVDNAPKTEATAQLIQNEFGHCLNIRYVREDRPGLTVARNAGLSQAKGSLIAITDDDVLLDRHWLSALVHALDSGDRVACVTGLILPAELETQSQDWLEQYGGFSKGFERRLFDLKEHRPAHVLFPYTAGQFGSGASILFRAEILRQLGGFDPVLGAGSLAIGGEDLAIFFSVIMTGHQLVYEPDAILYHFHPREYQRLQRQIYNYGAGLTAFLTKVILDRPTRLFGLLYRVPFGIIFMLSPKAGKNRHKDASYPAELNRLERRGMLYGPLAVLRSIFQFRRTHVAKRGL